MEGGDVEIKAAYPAGIIDSTLANLTNSAAGENHEYIHMYPDFAKIAREEGFKDIAIVMENIAIAEKFHEKRFLALAANIEKGLVFKKAGKVVWRCRNCGWIYEGDSAPERCAACAHPQSYFEVRAENW
jgi:rubrerythrin